MRKIKDHRTAFRAVAVLGIVWLAVAAPRPAGACSICRCGDPAFNALGLNIYEPNTFRIAFDWGRFDKSQGNAEEGAGGTEDVVENRFTATFSYSPTGAVTLFAQVPFATRTLTSYPGVGASHALHTGHDHAEEAGGPTTGRGLGDPELYALVRLWAAPFAPGIGRRAWVGVQLGVKTPWGANDLRDDGARRDEHVQPGTGSTDWIAGAAGVYVLDPASSLFGSLQYRRTGSNEFGYRYGAAALANAGYERRFGRTARFRGRAQLQARRDRTASTPAAASIPTPAVESSTSLPSWWSACRRTSWPEPRRRSPSSRGSTASRPSAPSGAQGSPTCSGANAVGFGARSGPGSRRRWAGGAREGCGRGDAPLRPGSIVRCRRCRSDGLAEAGGAAYSPPHERATSPFRCGGGRRPPRPPPRAPGADPPRLALRRCVRPRPGPARGGVRRVRRRVSLQPRRGGGARRGRRDRLADRHPSRGRRPLPRGRPPRAGREADRGLGGGRARDGRAGPPQRRRSSPSATSSSSTRRSRRCWRARRGRATWRPSACQGSRAARWTSTSSST